MRLIGVLGAVSMAALLITSPAKADEAVREAQTLLTELGYAPGPADGAIGKRTIAAMEQFLDGEGQKFDGAIDSFELELLRATAATAREATIPALGFPGRLIDTGHGTKSQCNALGPSRFAAQREATGALEPLPALTDAVSLGASAQWDSVDPWLKTVLTEAARYNTSGDAKSGEFALSQLEKWAAAGAIMGTPVDNGYDGAGRRGSYKPSASAPVLDMENAAQLGYAVYYALAMLDGMPEERRRPVLDWANDLTDRFGGPIGDGVFSPSPSGIWRLEARPLLARAVLEGDQEAYTEIVTAYYDVFRKTVGSSGAILKNANRGDRALHYQSQGILAFAAVLDIVESQGGTIPPDIEAKFRKAVAFFLEADRDNQIILPLAQDGYNNPGDGTKPVRFYRDSAEHYWWMIYYISKYPDSEEAARLRHLLAQYDTFENVSTTMMATTWVPYPINCYRPFDMSEAVVAKAAELVEAKYPLLDQGAAITAELSSGVGGIESAGELATTRVRILEQFRETNFVEYSVAVSGATIAGAEAAIPVFSIFTDFSGSADHASNLQLFRLVIERGSLGDEESRTADYLACGQLAASTTEGDQQLKLHVGEGSDKNECVLSKMSDKDRDIWSTVLVEFDKVVEAARQGPAKDRVRELHALVRAG